ncbi:DNA-binding protein [Pseudoduganella chitinolytica]|uniref:DNA-binding protein n=1 Tax=Pseudoduganella chitinolytica TaxID=34070 RepID=A0ABY8BF49_9BURK|nr:DNA-binding protein [Pseudoduganella chitinolytica]WEF34529.1 DNA-binding protein [Pseudoduganella chitinolytica]
MEAPFATDETRLQADIEALRPRCATTQELYREVCALMFFRYGITPTANRLYQLVRKGSMSAPAEALNKFWAQLREKSRVVIGHPDLPDELKTTAGELVASLWKAAQAAAAESLAAMRDEAGQQAEEAIAQAQAARQERDTVAETLAATRERLAQETRATAELRRELAELGALHANQAAKLDEARKELNAQHAWLNSVQRDHEVELDKLRDRARLDVAAADTARRQAEALAERERTAGARLQQVLDAERNAAATSAERHRAELRDALSLLADLRQQVGALEGTAAAAAAARDDARQQLERLRGDLAGANARVAGAEAQALRLEAELRHAAELFEARLAAARTPPVPAVQPAPRKPARRRGGTATD